MPRSHTVVDVLNCRNWKLQYTMSMLQESKHCNVSIKVDAINGRVVLNMDTSFLKAVQ